MANIRLSWPANPPFELVTGYNVWQNISNGFWNLVATVPTPEYIVQDPTPGLYRWKVAAVNLAGASAESNEASGPSFPSTPGDITVEVVE
jgi:hypothetical protein